VVRFLGEERPFRSVDGEVLNLIHDVGYMNMSMACAFEQLVMSSDIIGMAKRFLNGFEV